jgi:hypothetical protein
MKKPPPRPARKRAAARWKATVTVLPTPSDVFIGQVVDTLWRPHAEDVKEAMSGFPPEQLANALEMGKGEYCIAFWDAIEWMWQRYSIACDAGTRAAKERFADEVQAASDECLMVLGMDETGAEFCNCIDGTCRKEDFPDKICKEERFRDDD